MIKNRKIWSDEDIQKLIKLYPETLNENIYKILDYSKHSILYKVNSLGLHKSIKFRKKLLIDRNKTSGRNLTNDLLKSIALKYKTKSEFRKFDASAYGTAIKNGILEDICKHMTVLKFSTPQLILRDIIDSLLKSNSIYNDRKTIKPLEIDIYYPEFNLAFEYQGKRWHYDNKTDRVKFNILKEKNINIIYIFENTFKYEEDIKHQLIEKIIKINKVCNTKLTIADINNHIVGNIYLKLFNKEELFNIAKNYTSVKEFKKIEKSVYYKLSKMKLLNDAISHMADRRIRNTEQELFNIAQKYDSVKKFIEFEKKTYHNLLRKKIFYEATKHMVDKRKLHTTDEKLREIIEKYTHVKDLRENDYGAYVYIKKHKLHHLIKHLKRVKRGKNKI